MLKSLLHTTAVKLIYSYKWSERQVLRCCHKMLEKKGLQMGAAIGVIPHFTEDGDVYSPETWTEEMEEEALKKCPKYNSLVHIKVNDKKEFFTRIANWGTLGAGQAYMDGVWEFCVSEEDVTQFCTRFLEAGLLSYYLYPVNRFLNYVELCAFNLQTRKKSSEVIDAHYDLGNDLYESFLDPYMQYTCGYWAKADNLNDAQLDKLELIAKKLDLKPGMRVLDIGCGWGMLCKYLAERHGVSCVGVTISEEQAEYAREKCKGLDVEIRIQDYRDVNEEFDRMVVVGMLEHVGFHNYNEFFEVAHRNLKDDGIFVVHTIGLNHADMPRSEPWLHTYIFPNGNLPFPSDLTKATEGKFILEDWHNFGNDYTKTLRAWIQNFNLNWPSLKHKYDERFYRMWIYYLAMSAGVFNARRTHLWQLVLSKDGIKRDYRAAR